jgi:hypothetical protein
MMPRRPAASSLPAAALAAPVRELEAVRTERSAAAGPAFVPDVEMAAASAQKPPHQAQSQRSKQAPSRLYYDGYDGSNMNLLHFYDLRKNVAGPF